MMAHAVLAVSVSFGLDVDGFRVAAELVSGAFLMIVGVGFVLDVAGAYRRQRREDGP